MAKIRHFYRFGGMKIQRETIKAAMLERMREMGINVATLARQAGLSYDTPRDFLIRDKSGMPGADKLVAMLEVLNLTHLLIGNTPVPVGTNIRPRRSRAAVLREVAEPEKPWKSPGAKAGPRSSITDSGWLAEHEALLPGVPHEFIGKLCIVQLEDGRQLIRRVQPGSKPGHYLLEGFQPGIKSQKDAFVTASAVVAVLTQQ